MRSKKFRDILRRDPVETLLSCGDDSVILVTRRDLLGEDKEIKSLLDNPDVKRLLVRQKKDGSWEGKGAGSSVHPSYHYSLVETFKNMRLLIQRYGFDLRQPEIASAAEYLLGCQSGEGDIRGFIGDQYATYYTGAVLSLLIKAGYGDDERVEKGMQWLLSMRQDDGGWTIPILTHHLDGETINRITSQQAQVLEPVRSEPFSHNWTNMVLQAFAGHEYYSSLPEAYKAGELLKTRFFQPDTYSSYREARYWVRFIHWWPNILMALESLLNIGFERDDQDISRGLKWFFEHQREDGLWDLENDGKYRPLKEKDRSERLWLAISVTRMLNKAFSC